MKNSALSSLLLLSVLLTPRAIGGQAVAMPLSDFVEAATLIAVVEVTEVTQVDVPTSDHQLTSVFVAQATVEEVLKTDVWPAPGPGERTIAIVGSTQPRTSAVWRPIEKKRYVAFLTPEQGHYRYTLKHAFRPIDENNKVSWMDRNDAGQFEVIDLDLDEAKARIRRLLPADAESKEK